MLIYYQNVNWKYKCFSKIMERTPLNIALIFGMIITLSVGFFGIIGNLLTITAIGHQFHLPYKYRYIQKLSADIVLILNLAIADFLYCSISLPIMFITYLYVYQVCNITLCSLLIWILIL